MIDDCYIVLYDFFYFKFIKLTTKNAVLFLDFIFMNK